MEDTFQTIAKATPEVLFKEKQSKFFGYAFPVQSEEEVKVCLEKIKKQHPQARHWCYAYQIGFPNIKWRANDDGEPNHTAGTPILGQIQSFKLTNVLVIVVRYFGGIKLGVSGLIGSYRTTAQLALQEANIIKKVLQEHIHLQFPYHCTNQVMRWLKENEAEILHQNQQETYQMLIGIQKAHWSKAQASLNLLYEVCWKLDN
jgi:uncharacterized YigZ family protein